MPAIETQQYETCDNMSSADSLGRDEKIPPVEVAQTPIKVERPSTSGQTEAIHYNKMPVDEQIENVSAVKAESDELMVDDRISLEQAEHLSDIKHEVDEREEAVVSMEADSTDVPTLEELVEAVKSEENKDAAVAEEAAVADEAEETPAAHAMTNIKIEGSSKIVETETSETCAGMSPTEDLPEIKAEQAANPSVSFEKTEETEDATEQAVKIESDSDIPAEELSVNPALSSDEPKPEDVLFGHDAETSPRSEVSSSTIDEPSTAQNVGQNGNFTFKHNPCH